MKRLVGVVLGAVVVAACAVPPDPLGLKIESLGGGKIRVSGEVDVPDGTRVCWWAYEPGSMWGPPAGCANALVVTGGRFSGVGLVSEELPHWVGFNAWTETGPELGSNIVVKLDR